MGGGILPTTPWRVIYDHMSTTRALPPQAQTTTTAVRRYYPHLFMMWSRRGLSPRAAGALALAGCETTEQVAALGREWFFGRRNVGAKTLAELTAVAGWPPETKTPIDAVAASLALSIPDTEEAREAARDAVIGLHRAGFVIVASRRSAPADSRKSAG